MKLHWISVLLLSFAYAAYAGERPPALTARNVGHYAICPWLAPDQTIEPGSSYDRMRGLDFTIRNMFVRDDADMGAVDKAAAQIITDVNNGLAHNPPRTTLIRIDFWISDRHEGPMQPFEVYEKRMKAALKALEPVLDKVHGISISEENIISDGRPAVLDRMYKTIKADYPDLPCYQWYTPNTAVPGTFEGVFLSADGWIIDPYSLGPDMYPNGPTTRRLVQKYLVTGKPLIFIAPGWNFSRFFSPGVPNESFPVKGFDGWKCIDDQLQVCLEYNLPVSWYWFYMKNDDINQGEDGAWFPLKYNTDLGNQMTTRIHAWIEQARALPADYAGDLAAADRWENPPTHVNIQPGRLIVEDEFTQADFMDMTNGTGFRSLVWDGQTIAARGYKGADAAVDMQYRIESQTAMQLPVVTVKASVNPALEGKLIVSLSADAGKTWTVQSQSRNVDVPQTLVVDSRADGWRNGGPYKDISSLWVRIQMSGNAGNDDERAVTIDSIRIANRW